MVHRRRGAHQTLQRFLAFHPRSLATILFEVIKCNSAVKSGQRITPVSRFLVFAAGIFICVTHIYCK